MTPEQYNYSRFELGEDEQRAFADFRGSNHVGDAAPDGELIDALTGETVRLSNLWKRKHLVLEFGSFT